MKAIIVCSSYSYLERTELLREAYEGKGYDTTVIMTDFIHAGKKYVEEKKEGYIFVKTKPYYKNISPKRLYSHYKFAKDAFSKVDEFEPDLLHVLIPANSLAKEAEKYKKEHPNVKLYLDFIDLWPETMPIHRFKNTLPFQVWKNLRDKNLERADAIYCECDLYKDVLGVTDNKRYKTLYWAKRNDGEETHPNLSEEHIDLCYLGSINNIIDMNLIVEMCKEIAQYKSVTIHIIGEGEKKEEFLQMLRENQVDTCDYGAVYDEKKKQKIFDRCHFGLNIMKSTVCVGLTMKSLDYFRAQLPIINSIKGDTTLFVEEYKIGFNDYKDYVKVINQLKLEDYLNMRKNVKKLYEEKFTKSAFFREIL